MTPSNSRHVLHFSLLALFLTGPPILQAQLPAQPAAEGYSIKTSVRRVVVDVVVTDSQGNPKRDLTAKDFSLDEDGKPQRILSFDPHDKDSWAGLLPANVPPNTFINLPRQPEAGPLYILLYDMVNTGDPRPTPVFVDFATQIVARHQLVKFIRERPEGTRFSLIVNSDGLHLVQGFTNDKQKLLSALDLEGKTPHMPKVFLYSGSYDHDNPYNYLAVLKGIEHYVEGIPGRKNLIWTSLRFPFAVFPDNGPPELVEDVRKQLAHMAANEIAIYPISAGGVSPMDETGLILDEVAAETGGHAFYGSNDMAGDLEKAADDGETYYTLSYSSTNKNYDGKLRHIEVKLAQHAFRLAYRKEYYADPEIPELPPPPGTASRPRQAEAPTAPPDTLFAYIRHGAPESHDLLFSAHVQPDGAPRLATAEQMADLSDEPAYFRKRHKNKPLAPLPPVPLQTYTIEYGIPSRQFRLDPSTRDADHDSVEFAAAAYTADGVLLNGNIGNATSTTREQLKYYRAAQQFEVPTNAAWIAIAVRDAATGRIGNVEFSLPLESDPPK